MRILRKRLTCANRSDSSKNRTAILNVQNRYVKRMVANGWYFIGDDTTEGNSFFQWERYITLYKPSNQVDFDFIAKLELNALLEWGLYQDINKCKITKNGVRVMNELTKLGWKSLSYAGIRHSDFSYICGYSGAYNSSKMVKVF